MTKTKSANRNSNTSTKSKSSARSPAPRVRSTTASAATSSASTKVPRKAGGSKTSATKSAKSSESARALTASAQRLSGVVLASAPTRSAAARTKNASASPSKRTKAATANASSKAKSAGVTKSRKAKGTRSPAPRFLAPEIAEAMMFEMQGDEAEALEREAAREARERDLLGRLAVAMNRHDDMPNQDLAANIVFHLDHDAVSILVGCIERGDDVHAPDAARVLCEVGSRDAELLLPEVERLMSLCESGERAMLPFAMYALSPLAGHVAEQLWDMRDRFWQALGESADHSEMAQAGGVKLLSALCAAGPDYARTLAGGLVDLLGKCLPKDVALYAESVLPALGSAHSHRAKPVLDRRMKELTPAEVARLRRAVRSAQTAGGPYTAAA